jgi:hypothetical protein
MPLVIAAHNGSRAAVKPWRPAGNNLTGHRRWLFRGFGNSRVLRMRTFGGGKELVEHLMHAILPAQVFLAGVGAIRRVKSADVKIAVLGIGYKPVVSLPLFFAADVAGYNLQDHHVPPSPDEY